MDAAEYAGIDFFDVADVYPVGGTLETAGRTEEIVGEWLAAKRDRFVLATKVYGAMGPGPNDAGLSRRHVIAACDASLRRLRTDYIDLYYIHRWDADTPIDETLAAFDDLRRAGKIRYAGCSNVAAWQMMSALAISERERLDPLRRRAAALQPPVPRDRERAAAGRAGERRRRGRVQPARRPAC